MPAYQTGHGATFTLATSTFNAAFTMIGGFEQSREALDRTGLATTVYRELKPGDLVTPGELDLEFFFTVTTGGVPPITAAAESTTIDLNGATAGGCTVVGTGFFTSWNFPELVTDQILKSTAKWQWDGLTGPTITPES